MIDELNEENIQLKESIHLTEENNQLKVGKGQDRINQSLWLYYIIYNRIVWNNLQFVRSFIS